MHQVGDEASQGRSQVLQFMAVSGGELRKQRRAVRRETELYLATVHP